MFAEKTFFPGRAADLKMISETGEETKIGCFGVLHPDVLKNYEIVYPCSILEMEIELFM